MLRAEEQDDENELKTREIEEAKLHRTVDQAREDTHKTDIVEELKRKQGSS